MITVREMIRESNMIEGIHREPTDAEIDQFHHFMTLDEIKIEDLVEFVSVYQPDARLRDQVGLNVRIGNHYPPAGGPNIRTYLADQLHIINTSTPCEYAWLAHTRYENLHPFTDGNGRSGRMLWCWMMGSQCFIRGFLHSFYYQTLNQRSNHGN